MPKGIPLVWGEELADECSCLSRIAKDAGFTRLEIPPVWELETFRKKVGTELRDSMYEFNDKKGRELCLIPEATAVVQEWWDENRESQPKPTRLYYVAKCFRYDKPQRGRFRCFTQFGIEILGDGEYKEECIALAKTCLAGVEGEWNESVKRGLNYYVEDGFEFTADGLQILGGGRYPQGVGFALGIERLLLVRGTCFVDRNMVHS